MSKKYETEIGFNKKLTVVEIKQNDNKVILPVQIIKEIYKAMDTEVEDETTDAITIPAKSKEIAQVAKTLLDKGADFKLVKKLIKALEEEDEKK